MQRGGGGLAKRAMTRGHAIASYAVVGLILAVLIAVFVFAALLFPERF